MYVWLFDRSNITKPNRRNDESFVCFLLQRISSHTSFPAFFFDIYHDRAHWSFRKRKMRLKTIIELPFTRAMTITTDLCLRRSPFLPIEIELHRSPGWFSRSIRVDDALLQLFRQHEWNDLSLTLLTFHCSFELFKSIDDQTVQLTFWIEWRWTKAKSILHPYQCRLLLLVREKHDEVKY